MVNGWLSFPGNQLDFASLINIVETGQRIPNID